MEIAEQLYISEILRSGQKIIKSRIREKKGIPGLYCITLSQWKSGILEIYSYEDLISPLYESCDIIIVGLAAGKDDAIVLLRRMVDDMFHSGMINDVGKFFCGEKV
ncbi:hypothetical protein [Anaerostipes sp.]|uniref:hypothetical protein n=1 Tax=Anaerostipes sp. TaxID=1872530 RepID=UPI0025834B06|nr:hypothetical protein [Anaerostipes sp.]MCI5622678.1 hypothetical protein [Anaerostipes sp.]MDY2725752.1 hypothetical protein [Anaerostipes faecalis]